MIKKIRKKGERHDSYYSTVTGKDDYCCFREALKDEEDVKPNKTSKKNDKTSKKDNGEEASCGEAPCKADSGGD